MKLEFYSTAKDGTIGRGVRKEIKKCFESLEGKKVVITVDKVKKSRSDQQNRYLHLAFSIFKDGLNELGNDFSMGEVKELLKYKFLKTEVFNEKTGETIGQRVKGTAELTTTEMSEFIDKMILYAKEDFNLTIPLPSQNIRINYND